MASMCTVAHQGTNPEVLFAACTVATCSLPSNSTCSTSCGLPHWRSRAFPQQYPGHSRRHRLEINRFHSEWELQARRTRDAVDEELLEEELEEDMGGGLSEILSLLGFGIPTAILAGLWLFGQLPVTLLVSLALFPALQKTAGPAISGLWRIVNPPKRRSRQRWKKSQFRDRGNKTFYASSSAVEEDTAEKSSIQEGWQFPEGAASDGVENAGVEPPAQTSSAVGGWEQPPMKQKRSSGNGTRSRTRSKAPSSAPPALARPRQDSPLLLRVVFAVFPFLRSWGGFL